MSADSENQPTSRHPWETYDDVLNRDTRSVPDQLREGPVPDIGTEPLRADRYYDPDFFAKEVEHVWKKTWQFACREEEIPNSGDVLVYDVVGKSLLITRQSDGSIRAFHNSCLHRGRKLATERGCMKEFYCPYHGFVWNTDGTFAHNPMGWDFPHWQDKDNSLPEAKTATWGGFVFINLDNNAPPLEDILYPLNEHFARYDFENRYIAAHAKILVDANWKTTCEAFMESHHSLATHPQILPYLADVNSQYDLPSAHVSRHFSAQMVSSPLTNREYSEAEIVEAMLGAGWSSSGAGVGGDVAVPEGFTARAFMADYSRKTFTEEDGHDYSDKPDAEMLDALLYNLFPNMSFWAGYMPNLTYRWRPYGLDPEKSIMDVYLLKCVPKNGPRPEPAPILEIGFGEPVVNTGLDGLETIFEQDLANIPHVQAGIRASATGVSHLGKYSEMRIRQMHRMIDQYIAEGEGGTPKGARTAGR